MISSKTTKVTASPVVKRVVGGRLREPDGSISCEHVRTDGAKQVLLGLSSVLQKETDQGTTLNELAELLGMHRITVGKIRSGAYKSVPSIDLVAEMLEKLGYELTIVEKGKCKA